MLLLTHTENKLVVTGGGEVEERGIQPIFLNKCKPMFYTNYPLELLDDEQTPSVTA